MRLNLITEAQVKKIVKEQTLEMKKQFWKELEKLRKRIVDLELKKIKTNKKLLGD